MAVTFAHKVGIPPGTSTMVLPRGVSTVTMLGATHTKNIHQDPGDNVRTLFSGAGLGQNRRISDFELAPSYGYLPVRNSWVEGAPALYGATLRADVPIPEGPPPSDADVAKLQARAAQEQIKSHKHSRVTGTIQAIAIGGTFLLTLFALKTR